ncbi:hypothetical protein C1Y22_37245, partial [Pseudomonas sp. MPR-R2A5]
MEPALLSPAKTTARSAIGSTGFRRKLNSLSDRVGAIRVDGVLNLLQRIVVLRSAERGEVTIQ